MTDRIVRVILRGDIVGLKAAMAEGATVVKATADKMTASTAGMTKEARKETEKYRAGLATLGSQAGKVGLVAAAGFGLAVKSAADFNAEMALVRTLSHANASDMDRLSHAALTVGQNIGYSAKAVAQGEEELVKAGVSVKDILGGGLKGALDLAAAGQTDVATATSIAAAALTEFGLKGKDVPHVADELAAGADKALGSVEDLGLGLTQAGTTAHQMGFSLEQTVGTLTAFAQAGLIGERGGTTFKQMLLQLASPTSQAQKLMDQYGISLYNASGQIKTMPELAGNLSDALKGISPQARNAALGIIFGSRAIQGANILMANGSKGIQDWINKTNDQGFAAQQAAGKLDSLSGDVKKLNVALQTAFIGTGNGSQGPLRDLTQGATHAVNEFNKMPDSLHATTGALLAVTAVTGGGLWFGSKVIKSVADTRLALASLGDTAVATNAKLATLTRGAGVAAGVLAVLYTAHQLEKDDPTASVKAYSDALDGLGNSGKATSTRLDHLFRAENSNWANITAAKESIDGLKDAFGALNASGVSKFGQWAHSLFGTWDTRADLATSAFKKADAALTGMVSEGRTQGAADAFTKMSVAAAAAGVSTDQLAVIFPKYTKASLQGSGAAQMVSDAMTGLVPATDGAAGAIGGLGHMAQQSAADLAAQAKALEASRKAANATAHQFFGLGKSVNDSKVSLDGWISDLEKQAQALRDFTKNAQTAGKKGLKEGLIAELEAAGPAGALRMKQLANASETEIRRANRAWASGQRAIDHYTNVVGGVAPVVATDLVVNGVPVALSAVSELKRLLDSLHNRNIHVKVTGSTNATVAEAAANNGPAKADGGTIPHAAAGWTVAGQRQPYGDKVLAYLAPGEEVITNRNGEADRFRADRAAGRIPAYAAGMSRPVYTSAAVRGAVGSGRDSALMRLHADDLAQLVRGLATVRPIADRITVMPHNYSEWERQQAALTQAAGIGGVPR